MTTRADLPTRLNRRRTRGKLQAFEDLPRHHRVADRRDQAHRGAAARAPQRLDPEDALKQDGPSHARRELERDIRDFLKHDNGHPKPFIWTKSADQILASIRRFCQYTLEAHKNN